LWSISRHENTKAEIKTLRQEEEKAQDLGVLEEYNTVYRAK
jgi:hypothetical protein